MIPELMFALSQNKKKVPVKEPEPEVPSVEKAVEAKEMKQVVYPGRRSPALKKKKENKQ